MTLMASMHKYEQPHGAFAEFAIVLDPMLYYVPDGISFEDISPSIRRRIGNGADASIKAATIPTTGCPDSSPRPIPRLRPSRALGPA